MIVVFVGGVDAIDVLFIPSISNPNIASARTKIQTDQKITRFILCFC